jgi:predicted Zn finger-like uncharacterized protein
MSGVAFTHGDLFSVFTQCSKCETVFRLSAEALRAAGGQVRCGRCGEVFNALARLAEDSTGFKKGESSLQLETRADEILQYVESYEEPGAEPETAAEALPADDGDVAQLEVIEPIEDSLVADRSLEFSLPPAYLDRVFIETTPSMLEVLGAEIHRGEHTPGVSSWANAAFSEDARALAGIRALPDAPALPGVPVLEGIRAHPEAPVLPEAPASAPMYAQVESKPAAVGDAVAPVPAPAAVPEFLKPDRGLSAGHQALDLPPINEPRRQLPFAAWLFAAVLFAVLLAVQVLLGNRDWLAVNAPALGIDEPPAAKLQAYRLKQWGVTGDPAARGTLRVRASVVNIAAKMRPSPLLRVTLADRFGTRVAERAFEPSEYMGRAAHMLSAGERADVVLDIVDPGKDAESFEIDVCVRDADRKLHCAGDASVADVATRVK